MRIQSDEFLCEFRADKEITICAWCMSRQEARIKCLVHGLHSEARPDSWMLMDASRRAYLGSCGWCEGLEHS